MLEAECKENMPWIQQDEKLSFDGFTSSQMNFVTRYISMLNEVLNLEDQNERNKKVQFFTNWTFFIDL